MARYTTVMVFTNHFSDLSYIHLQGSTKGWETLATKVAFEAYANSHRVNIEHYHADNSRFAEKMFLDHAAKKG